MNEPFPHKTKTMYCYVLFFLKKISAGRNKTLVSVAFLCIAYITKAQPVFMEQHAIDSLHNIIALNRQDSNQVHALYSLSRGTTLSNTNKSVELGNTGLGLARKIKFPMGELECLEALSFSYAITSSFEKGFSTAYEAINLSKKYAPVREIFGINMMGLLYQKLGDDKEALRWAQKAYYHPGIKHADNFTQWSAMFLLAQEHERQNNLDSSYQFALETLDYSKRYFPFQEDYPMLILSRVNSKLKKYDEAVSYGMQALDAAQKTKEIFFANEVENELATIFFNANKPDSTEKYASLALQGATQLKNYLVIANSSNLLSRIFEKVEPAKAYAFLKISMAANDTVTNVEKTRQVKQLEIKEGQRVADLHLAEKSVKDQLRFNTAAGLFLSVLVISIILYRNNRNKQKANLALQDKNDKIERTVSELNTAQALLLARNAENELLLKEIHHRVKNNLEVVSSLLVLQSNQIDDENTREAMLEGQNRVQSIGIVHQKLYQGTNLGAIEMKDYFINLSESILDSFGAEKRVTIECAMDNIDVDIDTAVPLGLIVNELLTNTLKYAFPAGQHGNVQIKLRRQTDGVLQLEVSDDGVGKSGMMQGTGFGGQLVALLTQQLGGFMREEVKNGTSIYFEFKPIKAA
ncbi:MAG: Two-component sensor histidine kinase, contains HisKA and HATPase domain [Ferruginibacter sp.]|nr:Two-component sensor histidine kinase, contains HisKA and HATPase domain [Ferruginibacter sp.]